MTTWQQVAAEFKVDLDQKSRLGVIQKLCEKIAQLRTLLSTPDDGSIMQIQSLERTVAELQEKLGVAEAFLTPESLFLKIDHGDKEHQEWLKRELRDWFSARWDLIRRKQGGGAT